MTAASPLVVGVDLSDESIRALEQAIGLALDTHRPLVVVHAVGLLEEGGYRPPPPIEEIVATARDRVAGSEGVEVRVHREDGPAIDVLVRSAEREHAAYLVVGRRGKGESPRFLGSVSEGVLARAAVPVVVVPG